MALVTSRTSLSQGTSTTPGDLTFASSSGATTTLTSTAALPAIAADEIFEVRGHRLASNNGLYIETGGSPNTSAVIADKIFGADPQDDAVDDTVAEILGATGTSTEKSVFFDVQGKQACIIEQGNVDAAGVTGQAFYSFVMQEWKDDNFLIANAPFPMLAIDSDAGKYIIGQDISGNNNGFNWADESTIAAANPIRTRKMLRNAGWDEVDDTGITIARYVGVVTLGVFEDTLDTAYYQFGNDTTVNDTVDFTFSDTVNEAVQFFERLADGAVTTAGAAPVTYGANGRTITRSDGGNWRTDGFIVGGQITVRDAETSTNDGTFLLKAVADSVDGAVTCGMAASATFPVGITAQTLTRTDGSWIDDGFYVGGNIITTGSEDGGGNDTDRIVTVVTDTVITHGGTAYTTANTDDETIVVGPFDDVATTDELMNVAINNTNELTLKLRVRDGDPKGKTFAQANLSSAGKTILGNFVYSFPLANAADQKIDATDVDIDSNSDGVNNVAPYLGMTITYNSTAQVRTDLVGGSANFGIIVDANGGTSQEVFEFIQWSLRATGGNGTGDIDADGDVAYGRAMDGLARFVGDTGEFGTPDGLSFPRNPDGGGSGVYVDNLDSASKNDVVFYDNTNAPLQFPETISVTLDFNQIALDDAAVEYDLFYDRTVRTSPTGVTLTATTDILAGTGLPNTTGVVVGSYIRVAGLADATMDGVYQILIEGTPGASWTVARYDGVTITTVGSSTPTMDIFCIDTPDAKHVHTNVRAAGTASLAPTGTAVLSMTAPDLIDDTQSLLGGFAIGDIIEIEGTATNDGLFTLSAAAAGQLETVEQTILTESTATSFSVTKVVSGVDPAVDFTFSYDFSNNSQGDRSGTPTVFVKAKAIGAAGAQYVQSTVASIVTGTPLTIPLAPATERNYA